MPKSAKKKRQADIDFDASNSSSVNSFSLTNEQIIQISKNVLELLKPSIVEIIKTTISEILPTLTSSNSSQSNSASQTIPTTPWGSPPTSLAPSPILVTKLISSVASNTELLKEKSCRAVLEKLPNSCDENLVVGQIVEKCGLTDKYISNLTHRHPKSLSSEPSNSNSKPKIIKIQFSDTGSRDKFLFSFRKAIYNLPSLPKNLTIRRDMTPCELAILYSQRSKAYELNKSCGLFKYYVVDLEIRQVKNPKPFKTYTK
ncbi:hypothetical protein ACQ4LE_002899 [Meloidogyne hapla]